MAICIELEHLVGTYEQLVYNFAYKYAAYLYSLTAIDFLAFVYQKGLFLNPLTSIPFFPAEGRIAQVVSSLHSFLIYY